VTEFSRPISLADIDRHRTTHRIDATADEARALAERLGVVAVHNLRAELIVAKRRGAVTVFGTFQTEIEQVCVVTIDPFTTQVSGDIDEVYREIAESEPQAEVEVDLETPEPLEGDTVDLGELVVQHLALVIDPHPRAPGADLADLDAPEEEGDDLSHPFASLAKLQQKP
tara:strand:- start:639 stop:1148 length:510 start_codon:yes stop_codon:yes gene_type:complete